jgi:hypothetical protein
VAVACPETPKASSVVIVVNIDGEMWNITALPPLFVNWDLPLYKV